MPCCQRSPLSLHVSMAMPHGSPLTPCAQIMAAMLRFTNQCWLLPCSTARSMVCQLNAYTDLCCSSLAQLLLKHTAQRFSSFTSSTSTALIQAELPSGTILAWQQGNGSILRCLQYVDLLLQVVLQRCFGPDFVCCLLRTCGWQLSEELAHTATAAAATATTGTGYLLEIPYLSSAFAASLAWVNVQSADVRVTFESQKLCGRNNKKKQATRDIFKHVPSCVQLDLLP